MSDSVEHRKIIHVDMDAFYASVEQRDNPELRGKPVAVGGGSKRGVVAAASYEARRFGVRSAMASITAQKRCPQLIFVKPRFEVYREISQTIRAIFKRHTDLVEPLALDEAYLDVSQDKQNISSGTLIAEQIRADIFSQTGLTASAGVSYNKLLAKLASEERKPNGLFVIRPDQGSDFIADCAVAKIHGVGPRTAERMHAMGIFTGADLRKHSREELQARFGKAASYFYNAARGIDNRPVRVDRVRKSVGAERTFFEDIRTEEALVQAIEQVAIEVFARSDRINLRGKTATLKIKYQDFELHTRQASFSEPIESAEELKCAALAQMQKFLPLMRGVRLVGISLSNLVDDEQWRVDPQLSFDL
ncbi:MAG TPA: DNA polymerase IV [Marinobacterium sp.]|nr:DNA polymerase IV [Marinobacterium sp.]